MQQSELLHMIVDHPWVDVFAMPVQNNRRVLLDLVFVTPGGRIRLLGRAHDLPDGEEAFSLATYPFQPGGIWQWGDEGNEIWVPRNLKTELAMSSMNAILQPPRRVRFYSSPHLRSVLGASELLDRCAAIEFESSVEGEGACGLLIAASDDYPCAVEVGMTNDDRFKMLSELTEIDLR